jgi:RNase P subunit RPR2
MCTTPSEGAVLVEPIYVVCQRCAQPVATGVEADIASLASPGHALLQTRTTCSECGQQIVWARSAIWPESVLKAMRRLKG